jgi:hypothetical protein
MLLARALSLLPPPPSTTKRPFCVRSCLDLVLLLFLSFARRLTDTLLPELGDLLRKNLWTTFRTAAQYVSSPFHSVHRRELIGQAASEASSTPTNSHTMSSILCKPPSSISITPPLTSAQPPSVSATAPVLPPPPTPPLPSQSVSLTSPTSVSAMLRLRMPPGRRSQSGSDSLRTFISTSAPVLLRMPPTCRPSA